VYSTLELEPLHNPLSERVYYQKQPFHKFERKSDRDGLLLDVWMGDGAPF
jgi:hypothetical protein